MALAVLGWLQQRRAEKQAALEKEIAESNQKEEVLQAYFDRLAALLIDKNLIAIATKKEVPNQALKEDQELLNASRDVIRARTLSILRRLEGDGKRKGSVIQFLTEAEVISKLRLSLSSANLSSADLISTKLLGADLFCADLRDADLLDAKLMGADLGGARLSGANLSLATLSRANLSSADLSRARLISTKLLGADLIGADLSGATLKDATLMDADLSGANLSSADLSLAVGLTAEQVSTARLCKTKLPPDIQLDPDRDCEELEKDAQEIFF